MPRRFIYLARERQHRRSSTLYDMWRGGTRTSRRTTAAKRRSVDPPLPTTVLYLHSRWENNSRPHSHPIPSQRYQRPNSYSFLIRPFTEPHIYLLRFRLHCRVKWRTEGERTEKRSGINNGLKVLSSSSNNTRIAVAVAAPSIVGIVVTTTDGQGEEGSVLDDEDDDDDDAHHCVAKK